ncbi:MAG: phosphatidylserine decarboxylase family protein [Nitrospira sp.]|nr:phosphatidylserine decarboxylase family protein [Candidatus Manganitrophaceae bacterium]HIL34883.1 phosphatidylserine decarboxylase family protein [Candidatus Manganitrophaceae bacterium]
MQDRRFPIAKEGFVFIGIAGNLILPASLYLGWAGGIFLSVLTLFCTYFFRDPERVIPKGEGVLVSPADGKIVDISSTEEGRFLKKPAIKISIFLDIFNVHVNRSPVAGKVLDIIYNKGRFFAANVPKASLENEQNALILETDSGKKIVCIQIAGLIARRIVCKTNLGETLQRGERFGLIRFGSRVDLYLPIETEVRVSKGDKVLGGESVIGVLR